MKKFLFAAALIVGVVVSQIVVSQIVVPSQAQAKDYYLGVYEDGREAYLVTETVKWYEDDAQGLS